MLDVLRDARCVAVPPLGEYLVAVARLPVDEIARSRGNSGFLADFPHRGLFQRLTPLQGSPGNHPSTVLRLLAAPDQEDIARGIEDHRPDADERSTSPAGGFGTQGAATVGSGAGA